MNDDDGRSVVIDIQQPKRYVKNYNKDVVKRKESLKKQNKTKSPDKNCSLPTIATLKPLPVAIFSKEVFLPYLRYSKKQEKDRRAQILRIGLREKFKITYADLRKRLHTDDPGEYCRSITDYDPTFFKCVRSTLLSSYVAPFASLRYLLDIEIRWRQEIGYRRDCILNIESNHKREQEVYDASVKSYMTQVKYLDEFILADYKKSMLFLSKWESVKNAVNKKKYELQCLAAEKFTMTSKILGLDYRYGFQQKYGRFLYYLSPPSWRLKNRNFARSVEIEAKGFDFGISNEEDTFNVIFEKIKKECIGGLVKPVLYFKHPNDLLEIFDGIEQQHLHHFIHVNRLAPHASVLKKGIKIFKDIIAQDSAGVINVIKEFEKMLLFCEDQCSQLEAKFFKILNNSFYEDVGSSEVLKFQMHLEFSYAQLYNEKPMNLGIMATAKALEKFYMDYSERLETADNISAAIKQSIESERRKYKIAKMAARELRLFERLERALLRAHAPRETKHDIPIIHKRNSNCPASKKVVTKYTPVDNRKTLTESELEYLSLFTDWTEKEDPAHYLRSLSLEDERKRRSTIKQ